LRYSTEARATVRLCRIKEKCLETDLKRVNGWSSSTVPREFQSLGAATEKRRAAVSKLCSGTDRSWQNMTLQPA